MGNVVSDTCCTISGKDFNDQNNAYNDFMRCCDRNNCCIGDGGNDACLTWSNDKDASYTICADACNGNFACLGIGVGAEKSGPEVKINQGACEGFQACLGMGVFNRDKIEIGTESCVGEFACAFLGYQVEKESINVEWNSCVGPGSCAFLEEYSSKGVDVGYLSCLGQEACAAFGAGHDKTTIESGVCTFGLDSECAGCTLNSEGDEDPLIATFWPPFFCPF